LIAGLPDGIFSNKKSQFGQIFEGLVMDVVGIFYVYFVYFTAIWYISWPLGTVCVNLVYFWYFGTKNNLAALFDM
jgi:hypothetical protein